MKTVRLRAWNGEESILTAEVVNLINPETHGNPEVLLDREDQGNLDGAIFINTAAVVWVKISEP